MTGTESEQEVSDCLKSAFLTCVPTSEPHWSCRKWERDDSSGPMYWSDWDATKSCLVQACVDSRHEFVDKDQSWLCFATERLRLKWLVAYCVRKRSFSCLLTEFRKSGPLV